MIFHLIYVEKLHIQSKITFQYLDGHQTKLTDHHLRPGQDFSKNQTFLFPERENVKRDPDSGRG